MWRNIRGNTAHVHPRWVIGKGTAWRIKKPRHPFNGAGSGGGEHRRRMYSSVLFYYTRMDVAGEEGG